MAENEPHNVVDLMINLKSHIDFCREMGLEEILLSHQEIVQMNDTIAKIEVQSPKQELNSATLFEKSISSKSTGPQLTTSNRLRSRAELLEELQKKLEGCQRCQLHEKRTTIVFGAGDPEAKLVFVGEGPGADEDRQGIPFVGAAGQLLTRIIQAIGLSREEVYICNVVKCRPPGNRTPLPEEQRICGRFLDNQLDKIEPQVLVALGATAASYLLDRNMALNKLRGRFYNRKSAIVMPTYHPAYLLRSPEAKRAVWEDMKKVRDRLGLQR